MQRGLVALIAVLSATALSGCSGTKSQPPAIIGGGGSASSAPSSTPSPTTPHPGGPVTVAGKLITQPMAHDAAQAWVDFFASYADAMAVADPDWPDMVKRMSSRARYELRKGLEQVKTSHHVAKGPIFLHPVVREMGRVTVTIVDCVDMRQSGIYTLDGKFLKKLPTKQIPYRVQLVLRRGSWVVDDVANFVPGICQ